MVVGLLDTRRSKYTLPCGADGILRAGWQPALYVRSCKLRPAGYQPAAGFQPAPQATQGSSCGTKPGSARPPGIRRKAAYAASESSICGALQQPFPTGGMPGRDFPKGRAAGPEPVAAPLAARTTLRSGSESAKPLRFFAGAHKSRLEWWQARCFREWPESHAPASPQLRP